MQRKEKTVETSAITTLAISELAKAAVKLHREKRQVKRGSSQKVPELPVAEFAFYRAFINEPPEETFSLLGQSQLKC